MRYALLLTALSVLCCATKPRVAQLRHTRSYCGIEASIGYCATGKPLSIAYGTYWNRTWYWKLLLCGTYGQQNGVCYRSLSLQPTIAWSAIPLASTLYVNLTAALVGTYERHDENNRKHYQSNFNLGLALGGEVELFLTNHFVLVLAAAPQGYFLKNPYGIIGYTLSIGGKLTY